MPTPVSLQIAWRYLRGKQSGNAVPILSKISMVAIGIGAAALIILFSVSNGFSSLIKDLYNVFYPELQISPKTGKFVTQDPVMLQKIRSVEGVAYAITVIEANVLVEANEEQMVATLKGVSNDYFKVHPLKEYITYGIDTLNNGAMPTAIIGAHIAGDLGIDVNNVFSRLHLFYPNGLVPGQLTAPEDAFNKLDVKPDGVFKVQDDFDGKYILAPCDLVGALLGKPNAWSQIEIQLKKGASETEVIKKVQAIMGHDFHVHTRYEQNRSLYNIMNSEKLVMYFILLLVLIIASFNMLGALMLLVVEKQKDISIMKAMGMLPNKIAAVYRWEGVLWAVVGGVVGLILGIILCWCQQQFGWVGMGDAFVISAYPVELRWLDVLIVLVTVIGVAWLASLYPAGKAKDVATQY